MHVSILNLYIYNKCHMKIFNFLPKIHCYNNRISLDSNRVVGWETNNLEDSSVLIPDELIGAGETNWRKTTDATTQKIANALIGVIISLNTNTYIELWVSPRHENSIYQSTDSNKRCSGSAYSTPRGVRDAQIQDFQRIRHTGEGRHVRNKHDQGISWSLKSRWSFHRGGANDFTAHGQCKIRPCYFRIGDGHLIIYV